MKILVHSVIVSIMDNDEPLTASSCEESDIDDFVEKIAIRNWELIGGSKKYVDMTTKEIIELFEGIEWVDVRRFSAVVDTTNATQVMGEIPRVMPTTMPNVRGNPNMPVIGKNSQIPSNIPIVGHRF